MGYNPLSHWNLEVARRDEQLQYDDPDAPRRAECMVLHGSSSARYPCNLQVGATVGFASVVRRSNPGSYFY